MHFTEQSQCKTDCISSTQHVALSSGLRGNLTLTTIDGMLQSCIGNTLDLDPQPRHGSKRCHSRFPGHQPGPPNLGAWSKKVAPTCCDSSVGTRSRGTHVHCIVQCCCGCAACVLCVCCMCAVRVLPTFVATFKLWWFELGPLMLVASLSGHTFSLSFASQPGK